MVEVETSQLRRAARATLSEIADLCDTAARAASSHHASVSALTAKARTETMRDTQQWGSEPSTPDRFVATAALSVLHREIDDATRVAGISRDTEREAWIERKARLTAALTALENHAFMFALIVATLEELEAREPASRELHAPFRLAVALRAGDEIPAPLADEVTCHELRTFDPFAVGVIVTRAAPHLSSLVLALLSTLHDVSVKDACDAARASLPDPASLPGLEHHAPSAR